MTFRRCEALYDCDADNEDELSFREGEVIVLLREEEEEWWVTVADHPTRELFSCHLYCTWWLAAGN